MDEIREALVGHLNGREIAAVAVEPGVGGYIRKETFNVAEQVLAHLIADHILKNPVDYQHAHVVRVELVRRS